MPVRVLIADDHALVRLGIHEVLVDTTDIEIAGDASTGIEAQQLVASLHPDVVLLDLSMPGPPASETVTLIRRQAPETRVIVLTAFDDEAYVRSMLAAGASGYVLKDNTTASIADAIRAVMSGATWLSARAAHALVQGTGTGTQVLTDRELTVLTLVAEGLSNAAIAQRLSVTRRTVESHVRQAFAKLDAHSRIEALRTARRLRLLPNA